MGVCADKSAGWRSVDNTEYTAGRVDEGIFVTKNNNTRECSFCVNKGDHYLETESANVENTKNMTRESSEARSIAKSLVGSYITKSAAGNFIAKPAVERMVAESTKERSIATKPTTRNIKVKTKNCLECAMRHIECRTLCVIFFKTEDALFRSFRNIVPSGHDVLKTCQGGHS